MFIMLSGMPASGKSTFAREKFGWMPKEMCTIVSTDEIRKELFGDDYIYNREDNNLIFDQAKERCIESLKNSKITVFDATNLKMKYRNEFVESMKNIHIDLFVKTVLIYFNVRLEVCMFQDEYRENSVGKEVIRKMYEEKEIPRPFTDNGFSQIYYISVHTGNELIKIR